MFVEISAGLLFFRDSAFQKQQQRKNDSNRPRVESARLRL